MSLPAGSRFGPYQVSAQLGEGGMGEVYRAHDTRLSRDVALKVLHPGVSQSPDRRARFEREARSVAALNHPNIVAIFDVGEQDGVFYFVSELVEGESLRGRVEQGPLPARELLDIAVQIADGIAAAHAAGITHRDLKPENVMLTRDGRVKILDFGLARHASAPSGNVQDRTVTINETIPGTVLGTANYMSPEQVRGLPVDYRSDQFSFGVILYEMATGKQAFYRESAILTMSAVVTDEPPVLEPAVQAKLPAPLRWTMQRCLAKDPSRRYESSRDLYEDLRSQREHLSESISASSLPAMPAAGKPTAISPLRRWQIACAILMLCVVALAYWLYRFPGDVDMIAHYRFTPFAVSSEGQGNALWSPDGKAAAYMGEVNGTYQIFVRYLNSEVPVELTTMGIRGLHGWSPDSRRIYFSAMHESRRGIYSVAAVGGDPELVLDVDGLIAADVSADGKTLAVFKQDGDGTRRVYVSSPAGSPLQRYPSEKSSTRSQMGIPRIRFAPDGKKLLLLFNEGREKRWLLPYPGGSQEPREVLQALPQYGFTPAFSWFPDSRHILVALPAHLGDPSNLWVADVTGSALGRLTATPSAQYLPAVSPDGKRILYQEIGSDLDIAKVTLSDGKVIRLIATERDESMPSWAGRSGNLVYVTTRNGPAEIWMRGEDGRDRPIVTPADFAPAAVNVFMNPTLSPNGDRVFYTMLEVGGRSLLYISSTSGGAPTRVTNSANGAEFASSLSPDGKQLVYLDWDDSGPNVMLVKTNGQATPSTLRKDVYTALPLWSPTGEWINFRDKNGWHLISPDGKNVRDIGDLKVQGLAFSLDGTKLYGIRKESEHQYLFSFDVKAGPSTLKNIADLGKDYAPASDLNPGYRLSLAPDGTCAVYSILTTKSSIWLLEGFKPVR